MNVFHSGIVRKDVCFYDFARIMRVMENFPFYEQNSGVELKKMYTTAINNGYIYGFYTENEECASIAVLEKCNPQRHYYLGLKPYSKAVCITTVATEFAYRNKGICTRLLQHIIDDSKKMGYNQLFLCDIAENSMIDSIAKRNGFIPLFDAMRTTEYLTMSGKKEKRILIYMRKTL